MIDYETINYVVVLCCMYGIDDIRPRCEKEEGLCDILYRSDGL